MLYSLKYKQNILFLRETDGSAGITGSSIDQKPNSTVSVILLGETTFIVKVTI